MKNMTAVLATLAILIPSVSFAATPCTAQPIKFESFELQAARIKKVIKALTDEPLISAQTGHYEICFDPGNEVLQIESNDIINGIFDGTFSFKFDKSDQPVDIVNLKLRRNDNLALGDKPFLSASAGQNSKIVFKGLELSNVSDGLDISGGGLVEIDQSIIAGDSVKGGACLSVNAPLAILDGVKASSCSTGILVAAPGVKITNSEITNNGVGVQVADGIGGAEVLRSKVYNNTEGIVTAEEASAPIFFDGDTRDTKDIFPVSVDTPIINYADRPVYMNIPLNGSAASDDDVKIEFFLSSAAVDHTHPQGSDLVNKLKIDIVKKAKLLANEPEKYKIPAEHLNKPLIAIFTDPVHGTTGFSQQFTTSAGDVVAFVEAPFEMPTSGMDGAGTSGTDVQTGDGGGGVISGVTASAGPKGCGGQLVPVDHTRTIDIAMALWWIILAGALLGGLRTAAVRVRKR